MSTVSPPGATVAGVTHHLATINGAELHYVSAGSAGTPIVLVHGWPETWWAFHRLIPLLAESHRVVAVDLRGFGDSTNDDVAFGEAVSAEDLHHLVEHLGLGPVHVLCQDISGGLTSRFAATHPDDVLSFTAVESALAGFGLEAFADVNQHGSWHVGFLGSPGIPEMLLPGHERALIADWAIPMMTAAQSIPDDDIDELVRTYSRPHAWRGTAGLYQSVFSDAGATPARAASHPLTVPVLTVDAASHPFTAQTFRQVTHGEIASVHLEGVGHLVAQEAPDRLASVLLEFLRGVDDTE
jgi:pimeloyl-ACP methyl ester carboxylesterase